MTRAYKLNNPLRRDHLWETFQRRIDDREGVWIEGQRFKYFERIIQSYQEFKVYNKLFFFNILRTTESKISGENVQ